MFEWLNGAYASCKGSQGVCSIKNYDIYHDNFKLVDEETEKEFNVKLHELNLNYHFTYENNWAEKLYKKLLEENKLTFSFWSLESGDEWFFEVFRTETKVNNDITLVNYLTVFAGEIRGNVLSLQFESESKQLFEKWITEEMGNETIYNSPDCYYKTLNGIVMEEQFLIEKEVDYLYTKR